MVRTYRERIGYDPDLGIPSDEVLKSLDLEELIPLAEQIRAEHGVAVSSR
jgi:hypothetical protein